MGDAGEPHGVTGFRRATGSYPSRCASPVPPMTAIWTGSVQRKGQHRASCMASGGLRCSGSRAEGDVTVESGRKSGHCGSAQRILRADETTASCAAKRSMGATKLSRLEPAVGRGRRVRPGHEKCRAGRYPAMEGLSGPWSADYLIGPGAWYLADDPPTCTRAPPLRNTGCESAYCLPAGPCRVGGRSAG